jgi:S1-C subfamily serine protease
MSMFRFVIVIALLAVLINLAQTPSLGQTGTEKRNNSNVKSVAADALASLVVVFAKDKDGNVISQGSGFFVKRNRPPKTVDLDSVEASLLGATDKEVEAINNRSVWIVTNLHVLKWAEQIEVKEVVSGKVYPVSEAVGVDLNNDLCLLKLKDYRAGRPLEVADSDKVSIGESVLVAGNPIGLEGTISRGIVSALRKADNLIQIDAPGSSGGPVLNEQGRVIGVVVGMILGGQNLNFVIPSNLINRINLRKNLERGLSLLENETN